MRAKLLQQPGTTKPQPKQLIAATSVGTQENKEESERNFQSQQQQQSQIEIETIGFEPSTMHTSSLEIEEIKGVERDAKFDSPIKSTTIIDQAITDQESTTDLLVKEKPYSYQEEQDRHRENGGIPHNVGTDSFSIEKANTSDDWSMNRNSVEDDAAVKRNVEQPDLEVTNVDARWRSSDLSRDSGTRDSRKSDRGFRYACSDRGKGSAAAPVSTKKVEDDTPTVTGGGLRAQGFYCIVHPFVGKPQPLLAAVFPWDQGEESEVEKCDGVVGKDVERPIVGAVVSVRGGGAKEKVESDPPSPWVFSAGGGTWRKGEDVVWAAGVCKEKNDVRARELGGWNLLLGITQNFKAQNHKAETHSVITSPKLQAAVMLG
ncbi:hypothetical protein PIB30_012624 [Stylosanthes scabra]|uniref:Uncharacterized protein n=1 Tax=Stylosanthes scabra TaxID=79078 RepID=A0ABU6Y6P1_9FABA|nr:hypothetical protein [Stylosanthes scabra]